MRRLMLAALAIAIGAAAARPADADDRTGQLVLGGIERTWRLHLPRPLSAGARPLLIALHGGGGQGRGMARLTGFDGLADEKGLIVAYPDGIGRHWNDGRPTVRDPQDDVGFVARLIDSIAARRPVDRARVYVAGMSNGAMMAERLACDLSDRIAAIAAVSGSMPEALAPDCRPVRPVAVLQIGGTADPIMPFGGGAVADFGGLGLGGRVLSAPETAALWSRLDGCRGRRAPELLPAQGPPDGTRILRTAFGPCRAGTDVVLLRVEGAGHTWPGGVQYLPRRIIGPGSRQLDASRAIVAFFLAHPMR